MLDQEAISLAKSKWAALIRLPQKRLYALSGVKYGRLIGVTKQDSNNMPKEHESKDHSTESIIAFTLDANIEYKKVETDDKEMDKTAFSFRSDRQWFLQIPFVL